MIGAMLVALMIAASAGIWIPIGMRIERGRRERLEEIQHAVTPKGGVRLRSIRIGR